MESKNENSMLELSDTEVLFYDEELNLEDLEASLEAELESLELDYTLLKEESEKIGNPDSLGKIIIDEVWTQFGKQIGLDMTNETLIQAYNREHPEEYNKEIADSIMQDEKYKEANKAMKQQQQEGALTDTYTGKKIDDNDTANLDHVVPRKEIYDNPRRKQANIDTKDLANKKENLAPTNESLNKSKGAKSNKQYVDERTQREADLKKQNEAAHKKIDASNKSEAEKRVEHEKIDKRMQDKLDADDDLMMAADAKARKAINKDIAIGVTKQTAKKAGKDALKAMAVSALFDLLKSIMNGLVRFFKEKHKSFKSFLAEMKDSIKHFISHISSFVKTGVTSVVGTVISEIFGPIVSMFKKLASFIKQGVSSIGEAISYLTAKENKNKPLSIKIAQVSKIVVAGLTAAGAIISGELIEKALLNIPIMAVEIPPLGSIANLAGMFLASLLCGIIGAIVIHFIDRLIAKHQKRDNINSQIDKNNEISQTLTKLTDVKEELLNNTIEQTGLSIVQRHKQANDEIYQSLTTIYREDVNESDNTEQFSSIADKLAKLKN